MTKLFDNTFDVIEKSMDLRYRRHMLLGSNVANSETPNYRAKDLDFAGELDRALDPSKTEISRTDVKHLDLSAFEGAHPIDDNSGAMGADGNNVDLDMSMGKLADNSRSYTNAASWLGVQLRLLKTAARGRIGG